MAQTLKDEVKQEILKNALNSFLSNGYSKTSMKAIALSSGISVGNIYNYFKDKEALYDALAYPVFVEINELFKNPPKNPLGGVDEKINAFIKIYKANKEVFVMLLENSENTKFENLKKTVIENFTAAIERFRFAYVQEALTVESTIALNAFTNAFVNGIIVILTQNADEQLKLKVLQEFSAEMKNGLIKNYVLKRGNL